MAKAPIVHKDYWGEDITVGDIVIAADSHKTMHCWKITKTAKKKIRILKVVGKTSWNGLGYLIYPKNVIKADPKHATYLVLTQGGSIDRGDNE